MPSLPNRFEYKAPSQERHVSQTSIRRGSDRTPEYQEFEITVEPGVETRKEKSEYLMRVGGAGNSGSATSSSTSSQVVQPPSRGVSEYQMRIGGGSATGTTTGATGTTTTTTVEETVTVERRGVSRFEMPTGGSSRSSSTTSLRGGEQQQQQRQSSFESDEELQRILKNKNKRKGKRMEEFHTSS